MSHPSAAEDATLVAMFRTEAGELLDALDSCLLDLLANPDDHELVDRSFRVLHTLKGAATMYGYDRLSALAHSLESVFAEARNGGSAVAKEAIERALRAGDEMRLLLAPEDAAARDELEGSAETPGGTADARSAGALGRAESTTQAEMQHLGVLLSPAPDAFARGLHLDAIAAELATLGECTVTAVPSSASHPSAENEPSCSHLAWRVELTTDLGQDRVLEALMFLAPGEYDLEEPSAATQTDPELDRHAAEERRATTRRASDRRESNTIRVASHRLDELVDLAGELVTAHGTMSSLAMDSTDPRLTNVAEEIGRLASELRENVLSIRMVPIGTVFGKFRRHVHDLAAELGKEAEIVMEGGDTELDKGVLDQLAEPILHILRNSLDHGIESPEVRAASGKSPVGRISLNASQAGGSVHVVVADDGAGIDFGRVLEKAVTRGLVTPDAQPSEEALSQLLFDAGFSTSKDVTNLSGRGVGLDVVKRALDALHGSVSLASIPGSGTTISLSLPLTLAIIDGLISTVGTERYAIPLAAVEQCAEVRRPKAWQAHERDLLDVSGTLLPLVHLRSFFEVPGDSPDYQIAVIVSVEDRRFGIVVDDLVDSVQAVIKPLGSFMKRADGVSGTTVLGDGGVVPIIDPAELLRIADIEQTSETEGDLRCQA